MEAKELMIGDWVVYEGDTEYSDPVKIEGMDIATDMLITSDRDDVGFDGVWPIPLTPDILKKNDFALISSTYAFFDIDDNLYLEYYFFEHRLRKIFLGVDEWENHSKTRDITFQCNCVYVHELQHALRLCGIDKEIIL